MNIEISEKLLKEEYQKLTLQKESYLSDIEYSEKALQEKGLHYLDVQDLSSDIKEDKLQISMIDKRLLEIDELLENKRR